MSLQLKRTRRNGATISITPKSLPTIGIIGAGRLGTALACALAARGYTIAALVARRLSSAKRAARTFRAAQPAAQKVKTLAAAQLSAQLGALPPIDLFLITTPDDLIKRAAQQLAQAFDDSQGKVHALVRGRVALHASGALTSDELSVLRERGFSVGSLHPLLAISDSQTGADDLGRTAFFCIEGDRAAQSASRRLVRDLGGRNFSLAAKHKALYHAAAVVTSGHAVALFDLGVELLSRCGLSHSRARQVLLPLLRTTVENLLTHATPRALTGTFARADTQTVSKHLAALRSEKNLDDAVMIYLLLGERSLALAARNGVDSSELEKLAHVLGEARKLKNNSAA